VRTSLLSLALLIDACGAAGGVANGALAGEFRLPRVDRWAKTRRPCWIGNVIVGSTAAVVIAGVYGPLSQVVLNAATPTTLTRVTMAKLLGAVIVCPGGVNIVTQLAQRQAGQLARTTWAARWPGWSRRPLSRPKARRQVTGLTFRAVRCGDDHAEQLTR